MFLVPLSRPSAAAAQAGGKTLLLERAPLIGVGATGRNAGILSASINTPLGSLPKGSPAAALWGQTVQAAAELVREAAREGSLLQAKTTGAISLAKSPTAGKRLSKEKKVLQGHGFNAELISRQDALAVSGEIGAHCQLQRLSCQPWERQELLPFVVLAPAVHRPLPLNVTTILPVVADRREVTSAAVKRHRPQL